MIIFRGAFLSLWSVILFASVKGKGIRGKLLKLNPHWDPAHWMRDNMGTLGRRTLKQICLPGTNDAGMSRLVSPRYAKPCNSLSQSLSVLGQLKHGVRFLYLKPILYEDRFLTGSYRKDKDVWKGGRGQPIEDIVNNINSFTEDHKELIIVFMSGSLNIDLEERRGFNQKEWNRLFELLDKTKNLFNADKDAYLPALSLEQFTSKGTRSGVLYIIDDASAAPDLGERAGRGYFYPKNFNIYHRDSNSSDLAEMARDQLQKMKDISPRQYFLMSWVLSQGSRNSEFCTIKRGKSIKELAQEANKKLNMILDAATSESFPNIVLLNDVHSPFISQLIMRINKKIKF